MRFLLFVAIVAAAMLAQWYGEFYLKIGLEIATPLLLATVGISAVDVWG